MSRTRNTHTHTHTNTNTDTRTPRAHTYRAANPAGIPTNGGISRRLQAIVNWMRVVPRQGDLPPHACQQREQANITSPIASSNQWLQSGIGGWDNVLSSMYKRPGRVSNNVRLQSIWNCVYVLTVRAHGLFRVLHDLMPRCCTRLLQTPTKTPNLFY
jgi:hypothetical protein